MRFFSSVILLQLILPASAFAEDAAKQSSQPPTTINAASFYTSAVNGLLGHPLGTIVRVQGVVKDGNLTKAKAGTLMLVIESVNGAKLDQPVQFAYLRAPSNLSKPKHGERFDYYVHEYGAFDGVVELPKKLGGDPGLVANDGFHYRAYVTIHRAIPAGKSIDGEN